MIIKSEYLNHSFSIFLSSGCTRLEEQCHQGLAIRIGACLQGTQRSPENLRGQIDPIRYTSRGDGFQAIGEHTWRIRTTAWQRRFGACIRSKLNNTFFMYSIDSFIFYKYMINLILNKINSSLFYII